MFNPARAGSRLLLRPLFTVLALFTMLWSSYGMAEQSIQNAVDARIRALDVVSDMLLFYNPAFENHDPVIRQRFLDNMQQLHQWAAGSSHSELVSQLNEIDKHLQTLAQQPKDAFSLLPRWVNEVVKSHASLDVVLEQLTPQAIPQLPLQNQLALYLSMQNLAYQTVTFSSINLLILGGRIDILVYLDEQIQANLDQLKQQQLDPQVLQRLLTRYQIIRPRLIGEQREWVPNLVAFYYGSMLELLDQLTLSRVAGEG
ncbi:hypothetical protein [Oceanobacter mangrovi]|uniref:hypothetical protein n=1 Tax=Oceanobacter mangrovi TaxID=2862510 RepID=UPI001C8EB5BA|nr:hypothetical protein [Oceanobacter mangrovi]